MIDIDAITLDMSDHMISSFGLELDAKAIYSNNVLDTCLYWLSNHLSYYTNNSLQYSQIEVKQILIDSINKYIPKPKSDSIIDKATFNIFFNWALNRIVNLIVSKIFELIFIGNTLELNPKYVQNNPENTV